MYEHKYVSLQHVQIHRITVVETLTVTYFIIAYFFLSEYSEFDRTACHEHWVSEMSNETQAQGYM